MLSNKVTARVDFLLTCTEIITVTILHGTLYESSFTLMTFFLMLCQLEIQLFFKTHKFRGTCAMVIPCQGEKSICVYGDLDILSSSAMQSYYHSWALSLLSGESLEMRLIENFN